MADNTQKTEELITKVETAAPVAERGGPAIVQPVGARHAPEPLRASKSTRKHIRRLKQAGEFRPTDRRR